MHFSRYLSKGTLNVLAESTLLAMVRNYFKLGSMKTLCRDMDKHILTQEAELPMYAIKVL